METIVCIECPNGCELEVEKVNGEITVRKNRCKRGVDFAKAELLNPKRTISSTVKTVFPNVPVLPVRVSAEIPKARIFDVMKEINNVCLDKRIGKGEIIIQDVLGLGADIIATSNILKTL
ncbi:MAG: hypothetical protein BWY46_01898 [Firmicutes bacterium ADurb.Bin300]|jgi:CxxC motif-containing protein|nr:MAG: hypothetical protein BWY46_01898 [Firmicutes bacterium ADurb.Bin300]